MTDDLDTRRRRARYRAEHRGTKEMDILLGGYAAAKLEAMTATELALFEQLLAAPDPELQATLMAPDEPPASAFAPLLVAIRSFHGLPAHRS